MRTRRALAAVCLAIATAAGCSSGGTDAKPDATPTIGISDLGIGPDAGIPSAPTGTDRTDYLSAARGIDPAISQEMWSDASLIYAGQDACQAIHQNVSEEQQASSMATRLSNAGWTATDKDAQQLIEAAHTYICPDY